MDPKKAAVFTPFETELKNGRTLTVRLLEACDAEPFVEFYGAIPAEDNRYYIGADGCTPEKARARADRAESPVEVCLVLDGGDGRIYGEAWYSWKDEENAKSTFGICISRELQGQGAGKGIMSALMDLSAKVGPEIMTLTVQKENERAADLYQKLGFKIIKEQIRPARKDCPELPEYYMERQTR
ncbi:MAG: GNAT family N-acetyltransferase [Planctomycetota bacterium]|jgi:RimJ/RimL family protein N-acetyltransferase